VIDSPMIRASMLSRQLLLQVLHDIRRSGAARLSLGGLAARAGWSPFYLHRSLRAMLRETPKQYLLRLQVDRAAGRLMGRDASVRRIALDAGFASHEVFTRAFRRRFGLTPAAYRATVLNRASQQAQRRHRQVVDAIAPCLQLFHLPLDPMDEKPNMPTLSIARRDTSAQPVLFVRLRPARHELPSAIAQGVGLSYAHAQQRGLALVGQPFTRYLSSGPGLLTIETGVPVSTVVEGAGQVVAGALPAGPVAVAIHAGPYEQLADTYAALERWIESNGYQTTGAPWETYVTDPADHPDPADWRTEVCWPLK
jgi:AraC family transcriptional regulator